MLQRIQTIWLFCATAAIFCLFLFPFIQFLDLDGTAKAIKATGVYQNLNGKVVQTEPFIALTIATVVVGLIPFVIIFFYKNRKKQLSISYIAILLILAYSFWLVQTAKQEAGNMQLELQNYGIGVILPSLAILFIILALRGIRRDQKLIRSADRLR
jgi:peptidoglycan/LPS O-acetylase OafA/YrhL